jgi:hypothetical protein
MYRPTAVAFGNQALVVGLKALLSIHRFFVHHDTARQRAAGNSPLGLFTEGSA